MTIQPDDLTDPRVHALIQDHLTEMVRYSPADSIHALSPDGLLAPDVTVWTVWDDRELLGCGALRELDPRHGELKSMHTARDHRGRGVGTIVVRHLITEALRRGYHRLSLETGAQEAFLPARRLYTRHGFVVCEPFGDYLPDPASVFMTLRLR